MREIRIHDGETFYLVDGFIRPETSLKYLSCLPGNITWTEDDMSREIVLSLAEDYKTPKPVGSGWVRPLAVEMYSSMRNSGFAARAVMEDKMRKEHAFLMSGASEVWFVHWGNSLVVLPTESFATGVFLGVK